MLTICIWELNDPVYPARNRCVARNNMVQQEREGNER